MHVVIFLIFTTRIVALNEISTPSNLSMLGRFSNGHFDTWLNLRLRSLFSHQLPHGWRYQRYYLLMDSLLHKELDCRIHNAVCRPGCGMKLPIGRACVMFPRSPQWAHVTALGKTWIYGDFYTKLSFCIYCFLCFSSNIHACRGKITNQHKCWNLVYLNAYLENGL
jgi:hypothetical protein